MDSELRRVAADYKALLGERQRLRNAPDDFKVRVLALTHSFPRSVVADAVGLNTSTLLRWSREARESSLDVPATISVTRLPSPVATGGEEFESHLEIVSRRGEMVRVPFRGNALERVLAVVLERNG